MGVLECSKRYLVNPNTDLQKLVIEHDERHAGKFHARVGYLHIETPTVAIVTHIDQDVPEWHYGYKSSYLEVESLGVDGTRERYTSNTDNADAIFLMCKRFLEKTRYYCHVPGTPASYELSAYHKNNSGLMMVEIWPRTTERFPDRNDVLESALRHVMFAWEDVTEDPRFYESTLASHTSGWKPKDGAWVYGQS